MIDPASLRYAPTHEWVLVDEGVATIGITKFAVEQLTDLILIDLSKARVGTKLKAGQAFGEIESVKAVSDLYSPVNGEIVEINKTVASDVSVLADDPYEVGWLIRVKLDGPLPANLMEIDAYRAQIASDSH